MSEQVRQAERSTRSAGRRGLIAGAAALAAAGLAKAVTPEKAEAADGGSLILGQGNTSQSATWIHRDTAGDGAGTNCLIASPADTNGNGFLGYGAGTGTGVQASALGSGKGLYATSANGTAIYADGGGINFNYGVYATSKGLFGVLGIAGGQTSAAGIRGQGGQGSGDGVQGIAANGDGVFGYATTGTGVSATSDSGTGMFAFSESGAGAIGKSNQTTGVYGLAPVYGVWGRTVDGNGVFGQAIGAGHGVHGAAGGPGHAGFFEGSVFVTGNFTVLGAKSAAVKGADGGLRRVYCVEMPESYFEDAGRGKLSAGQASVSLDKEFAAIVKNDDYEVFLTPYGDCKGLYVGSKTANGFTVGELQGGKGEIQFAYRVLAKRKDAVGARLEKVNGPDVSRMREAANNVPAEKPRERKAHLALPALEVPKQSELPTGVSGPGRQR